MSFVKPSKFIPAGYTRESDYESDYDGAKIRPRWTPAGSDAEYEPAYRKVQPPSSTSSGNNVSKRAASGARTPTPPSVFDQPPSFQGPPRPVISPTDVIKIKSALEQSEERPVLLVKPKAIRPPVTAVQPLYPALQPAEEPVYSYAEPPPPTAAAARKLRNCHNFFFFTLLLIYLLIWRWLIWYRKESGFPFQSDVWGFSHKGPAFRPASHFGCQINVEYCHKSYRANVVEERRTVYISWSCSRCCRPAGSDGQRTSSLSRRKSPIWIW